MAQSEDGSSARFALLDGMRGLAALIVVLDHVDAPGLQHLIPHRALAVDFFFVLSGYVIMHAYGPRLSGGMSVLAFLRARMIRLYPLYMLGVAIFLAALSAAYLGGHGPTLGGPNILAMIGFGATFLPCPAIIPTCTNVVFPLNGPAWSLFFELAANAAFALAFAALSVRRLTLFVLAAAIVFAAAILVYGGADVGWGWSNFPGGAARVTFSFFMGVLLYMLRARARVPAAPAWSAFLALFAIAATPAPPGYGVAYDMIATIIVIPLLVASAGRTQVSGVTLTMCAALGALSYPLYMLHVPILKLVEETTGLPFPAGAASYAFAATLSCLIAALAYRFYDAPARRWLAAIATGGRHSSRPDPAP